MKEEDKGCHNCAHRHGQFREFWKCSRVGDYTSIEMQYGGDCAKQGKLLLWTPRLSVFKRLQQYILGVK